MVETTLKSCLLAFACTSCFVATTLNIMFTFCLRRSADGASVRQPLYFLLTAMLGNSTVHQLMVMLSVLLNFLKPPFWLLGLTWEIICQTFSSSFSTCAWMSIVYYLKIVPQHHAMLLWIKKNIRTIVYAGFVFDQILLLSSVTMNTIANVLETRTDLETIYSNRTTESGAPSFVNTLFGLSVGLYLAYFICPVGALTYSWGRTFCYLFGHIKRMEQTGSSSCKQQRNQMMVTIMGMVQTLVFIPSSLWVIVKVLLHVVHHQMSDDGLITMTITSVCGLANILCLGFSQTVFRARVVSTFKGFKEVFRM